MIFSATTQLMENCKYKPKISSFSTVLILVYTPNGIWPEVKVISDSSRSVILFQQVTNSFLKCIEDQNRKSAVTDIKQQSHVLNPLISPSYANLTYVHHVTSLNTLPFPFFHLPFFLISFLQCFLACCFLVICLLLCFL